MPVVQVTRPTERAIDICEAREHLRILDESRDTEIYRIIDEATEACEAILGGKLMTQTVRLDLDTFPSGKIELGTFPIQSISSFVYDDSDNTETAMVEGTDYWTNISGKYPYIAPLTSWPSTYTGKLAAVRISMTVGYSSVDDIPRDIKRAILIQIKQFFDYGDDWIQGIHASPLRTINNLLFQHKRMGL